MEVKDLEDRAENVQNHKVVEEYIIPDNKITAKVDVEEKYKDDAKEDEEKEKSDTKTDILEIKVEDTLLMSSDFCLDNFTVEVTTETAEITKNLENCKNLKTNESLQINRNNKNSGNNQNLKTESCGNIYVSKLQQKLIFNCELCNLKYSDLENLGRHLHQDHTIFQFDDDNEQEHPSSNLRKSNRLPNKRQKKDTLHESFTSAPPVALPLTSFAEPLDCCGNVFIVKHRTLFMACGYCDWEHDNLDFFEKHLQQQHHLYEGYCHELNIVPKIEVVEEEFIIPEVEGNISRKGPKRNTSQLKEPETSTERIKTTKTFETTETAKSEKETTEFPELTKSHIETVIPTKSIKQKAARRSTTKRITNKKYECDMCGTQFRTQLALKRHKLRHANLKKFICVICEFKSSTKRYLNLHMRHHMKDGRCDLKIHLGGEKPFICNICNKCCCSRENLGVHKKSHMVEASNKPYKCEYCAKKFGRNSDRKNHMRTHTGEKPYKCEICQRGFSSKLNLQRHIEINHTSRPLGDISSNGLEPPPPAIERKKTDPKPKALIKELSKQKELIKDTQQNKSDDNIIDTEEDLHLLEPLQDSGNDRRYHCSKCPKVFARNFNLKVHKRIHTGEKPYVCDICNKCFRSYRYLNIHKKLHINKSSKKFKCEHCDMKFRRNVDRKIHMRTHTGERPYKCEICQSGFSSKLNVQRHIEINHTSLPPPAREGETPGPKPKALINELSKQKVLVKDQQQNKSDVKIIDAEEDLPLLESLQDSGSNRRYRCSKCPQAFAFNSQLKMHERIHTGEKPYVCDICNKCFPYQQNLKKHEKTHMGESSKKFKCEHCDMRFRRNLDRKVHMRSHTGENPHTCEICQRGFCSKFSVQAHVKRYHNGMENEAISSERKKNEIEALREELEKNKKIIEELRQELLQLKKN